MKTMFEEPKLMLEQFSVTDQTMTVSWIPELGENETNPFGNIGAITNG